MTHLKSAGPLTAALAGTVVLAGCQVTSERQALGPSGQPVQPRVQYAPVAAQGTAQDQRMIAGREVQILTTGNGHAVLVDGHVVANDTEDDRVVIQGVYHGGGRTYVLVSEQSGGIACPSMYQAIDLSGSVPIASPQIGNCSDLPRVSVVGGGLRVSLPAFRASLPGANLIPAKVYSFRDGQLTR